MRHENKLNKNLLIGLILVISLSACAPAATEPSENEGPTATSTFDSAIATAVANAFTAAAAVTTNTPTQTSTPAFTATALPTFTFTLAPATETPQPAPPTVLSDYDFCDNSAYVSDITIKDGTVLMPGEPFKKIWRLQNNGACPWRPEYTVTFVSGYNMDGVTTTINQYVAPGKSAKITVTMKAPTAEGTYTGYWSLTNFDGINFGEVVYVRVVVSKDETEEEPE